MFNTTVLPMHVATWDLGVSPISVGKGFVTAPAVGALTWTANLSVYVPMYLPWDYPVNRVWWLNGSTASSNMNFGIFQKGGKRVYATGSTAQAGASVVQYVTPTPFWLPQGEYFFALACDGTTNRAAGTAGFTTIMLSHMGVRQQAANFALADPATFAAPTVAAYPMCGITRRSSGL
jgi:hypothetical protein